MNINNPIGGKGRRRSNLGKRFWIEKSQPNSGTVNPAGLPSSRENSSNPSFGSYGGLSACRSGRVTLSTKKSTVLKASRELRVNKRLFLKSPDNSTLERLSGTPSFALASPAPGTDSSLNLTGVTTITTPSSTSLSQDYFKLEAPKSSSFSNRTQSNISRTHYTSSLLNEPLKPPSPPPPSLYKQIVDREFADLKPPVDPMSDPNFMKYLSLEDKSLPSKEVVPSTISTLIKEELKVPTEPRVLEESPLLTCVDNSLRNSHKKLSIITEERQKYSGDTFLKAEHRRDSIEDFLKAEETLCGHEETITDSVKDLQTLKNIRNIPTPPKTNRENLNEDHSFVQDEELDEILQLAEDCVEDMRRLSKRVESLKASVQRLKIKRKQTKNHPKENKENLVKSNIKEVNTKWMKNLKAENPGLFKTPKPLRTRESSQFNVADQTLVWTPHSLSSVIHEQMDELFE